MLYVWVTGQVHTGFRWGDWRERDHLKDLGVDGCIILKLLFRKWDGGLDRINVVQDMDKSMGLVNAVMKFRESYDAGDFLIS
jgi:hypothetical protein